MTRPATWKPAQHGLIEAVEKAAFEYYWNTPDVLEAREMIDHGYILEPAERERLQALYRHTVQAYARGRLMLDLAYRQEGHINAMRAIPHADNPDQESLVWKLHGDTASQRARQARRELRALNRRLHQLAVYTPVFVDTYGAIEENDERRNRALITKDDVPADTSSDRTYSVAEIRAMLGNHRE